MGRGPELFVKRVEDDGLVTNSAGEWTIEKYRRMGYYADLFSRGTKNSWGLRVYVDLFAGSGHTTIDGTEEILLGSPLIAMNVRDPFDRYILCDENAGYVSALKQRVQRHAPGVNVQYFVGDANESVAEISNLIPRSIQSRGVLTFCFVDPYDINIDFETVRYLADRHNIDFLMLLALGMDATRNIDAYPERVDRFLGDDQWRRRWEIAKVRNVPCNYCIGLEYAQRMEALGYLPSGPEAMIPVRSDRNALLYYLALFSRAQLARNFWKEVIKYSTAQTELLLPE